METRRMSIPLPFAKIVPSAPANKEFTLAKVYVCSPGKNRNMSFLSKSELDAAAPSLAYTPVVGHLMEKRDEDGNVVGHIFGGHDFTITDDFEIKPLTVPFGVVTADAPQYETIVEFGKEKEYLTAYAMLWTGRYPELKDAIYSDDIWFGQSMEINYENYEMLEEDSNYIELHGLNYSALCILGKSDDPKEHVEPCFPNAHIEPVKFDLNTEQFSQAMAEMREHLSHCFEMNASKKGGKTSLSQEKITEIFALFGIAQADVDFAITEDMTEEQLTAAIEAFKAASDEDPQSGEGDPTSTDGAEPAEQFFSATANQKREALRNVLDPVIVRDSAGKLISETYYWVEDFDDQHVFVERDYWTSEGSECKFGRFAYSFDDSNKTASITSDFEEMFKMWLTKEEVSKVENDRKELDVLRTFKAEHDAAEFEKQVNDIMDEFSDLSSMEEYAAIRDKAAEFASLDDMKIHLFALRGKNVVLQKKTPASNPVVRVGIDHEEGSGADKPLYGGIFQRYNIGSEK